MDEQNKPVFEEQFRTSARPVFLRYGALILLLSAIFLFLYFEGKDDTSTEEYVSPEELLNQAGGQEGGATSMPAQEEEPIKLSD